MSRTVSEPTGRYFEETHGRRGVRFRFGASAVAIGGHEGRAVAVETADGSVIDADAILVGIGVIPNTELAAESGLEVRNGIVVDTTLLTSDPSISAVGDCASVPSPFADGKPVLIESVQNAVDGAKCLASRLLGRPEPLTAVPWFWSDQGSDKLQIAGLATPHDETVVTGTPSEGAFSVLCFRGGFLAGVESVNRAGDHMAARRLLSAGIRPSREDASRPDFDLKVAMKALRPA
jgi:3-phenylpropionate/trans-cinnamate dioxygenase ferredoxin reductase subunit